MCHSTINHVTPTFFLQTLKGTFRWWRQQGLNSFGLCTLWFRKRGWKRFWGCPCSRVTHCRWLAIFDCKDIAHLEALKIQGRANHEVRIVNWISGEFWRLKAPNTHGLLCKAAPEDLGDEILHFLTHPPAWKTRWIFGGKFSFIFPKEKMA